jgi:zinc transporter 7
MSTSTSIIDEKNATATATATSLSTTSIHLSPTTLKIFVAFAIGALLGDAFLHLIPHSFQSHSHSHAYDPVPSSSFTFSNPFDQPSHFTTNDHNNHNHHEIPFDSYHKTSHKDHSHHDHIHNNTAGMLVLAGMFMFFIIEKLARSKNQQNYEETLKHKKDDDYPDPSSLNQSHSHGHSHSHSHRPNHGSEPRIKASYYAGALNLIADVLHNFTDGLAIYASFSTSPTVGISTTVAVFFHEIPHELGDIAILLQSGYTTSQAMMIQLITAVGAITGVWIACILEATAMTTWITPFAAGGFIYVGLVTVLPTLLEVDTSIWHTLGEISAMISGVMLMASIED